MKKLAGTRLQPGRRLLGLLALVSLLVTSVDAGPRHKKKRPPVRLDVPQLVDDKQSKNFLATRIADDTQVVEGLSVPAEDFNQYAESLAEVLATFTPAQQRKIIYGQ